MKRWLCAVCSLCLSAVMSGCFLLPVEEEAPQITLTQEEEAAFVFTQASVDTVRQTFSCRAVYTPTAEEVLSFSVTGAPIAGVYVELGEEVTAGQLLAELDCTQLREDLDSAQFRLDVAYLDLMELESSHALILEGLTDEASRQAENTRYETQKRIYELQMSAEAGKIEELEEKILERQIHAGMDGLVTFLHYAGEGETVSTQTTMVIVADSANSAFVVSGMDARELSPGDQVTLRVNQESYSGTVVEDTEIIEEEDDERAFIVPEGGVTFAESARAEVTLIIDQREDVVCVDRDAVRIRSGAYFVYMLDENGLQVKQEVTIGLVGDDTVEILSGLSAGDMIILE